MSFHDSMYDDGFCSEEDYLDYLYDLAEEETARMNAKWEACMERDDEFSEEEKQILLKQQSEAKDELQKLKEENEEKKKALEPQYKEWVKTHKIENICFQLYSDICTENISKNKFRYGEKHNYNVLAWDYWVRNEKDLLSRVRSYFGGYFKDAINYYIWKEEHLLESFLIGPLHPFNTGVVDFVKIDGKLQEINDYEEGKFLLIKVKEWSYFNYLCKTTKDWYDANGEIAIKFRDKLINDFNSIRGVSRFFEFYVKYYREELTDEGYNIIMKIYKEDRQKVLSCYFRTLFVRIVCNEQYLCNWLELPNESSNWRIKFDFEEKSELNEYDPGYTSNPYDL